MGLVLVVVGLVILAVLVGSIIVEVFTSRYQLDNITFSSFLFLSVLLVTLGMLLKEVGL